MNPASPSLPPPATPPPGTPPVLPAFRAQSVAEQHRLSGNRGYPRPQLRRAGWVSLNGTWDFAIDAEALLPAPTAVSWDRQITVPFSPETDQSGVSDQGFYRACWYRRGFDAPLMLEGDRLLLNFGAVDHSATVWVNGALACQHEGGYTPFQADITDLIRPEGPQEIIVRAYDDPADLSKPRGKQDWQLAAHSIWYPRTSGIWQTVWMEQVPPSHIAALRWTPHLARWEIGLEATIEGRDLERYRLRVRLQVGAKLLADDSYEVVVGEVHRRIALSDPGIDDSRNELLWSPASPTLIEARIELLSPQGERIDAIESYTALRSIAVHGDRFILNGRPYPLRLVLDQGYWDSSGLTAPDDEALRKDVELARAMGFNGVRKHQKVEDPRYLYWADRLGLLVWGEMPSAYRFTTRSIDRLTREWLEVLRRDFNHPCVVTWVPFNESWGVPNLPDSQAERNYIQALYHLTKTYDPSRPVIGNDGWESMATDLIGIHDYDSDLVRLARRYHADEERPRLLHRERPGGRSIVLEGNSHRADHPMVLSEFGGLALSPSDEKTWGYSQFQNTERLAEHYRALLECVRSLELFAGFCYTQFADTYQETNGLLYSNRTPKFPLEQIAAATRGLCFRSDLSMPPAPSVPRPPSETP